VLVTKQVLVFFSNFGNCFLPHLLLRVPLWDLTVDDATVISIAVTRKPLSASGARICKAELGVEVLCLGKMQGSGCSFYNHFKHGA